VTYPAVAVGPTAANIFMLDAELDYLIFTVCRSVFLTLNTSYHNVSYRSLFTGQF